MSDTTTFPECGNTVPVHRFCNDCGASLDAANDTPAEAVVEPSDEATNEVRQPVEDDTATATTSADEVGSADVGIVPPTETDASTASADTVTACSTCGCTTPPGAAKFCQDCGHPSTEHVAAAASGCSDCECTAGPTASKFCPECGHVSVHHTAGRPLGNEEVQELIYGLLREGRTPSEIARKCNALGLGWDGEPREWSATNIDWFRSQLRALEPPETSHPRRAATPATPSQALTPTPHGKGRKTPEEIRASNRKWFIGSAAVIAAFILLAVVSAVGSSNDSQSSFDASEERAITLAADELDTDEEEVSCISGAAASADYVCDDDGVYCIAVNFNERKQEEWTEVVDNSLCPR